MPITGMGEITVFLSTPSVRRATEADAIPAMALTISIHALREEGDQPVPQPDPPPCPISIHALREEGDPAQLFRAAV